MGLPESDPFPKGRWKSRIDTSNKFGVCVTEKPEWLKLSRPAMGIITKEEALNLAAWLFVLADPKGAQFYAIVDQLLQES